MWFDAVSYFTNDVKIISTYREKFESGILLDTTPFLILFLGKFDKENGTKLLEIKLAIKEGETNRKLNLNDFKILRQFINGLNRFEFFITPHIFTEAIQHIWEITSPEQFTDIIKYFFNEYSFLQEVYPCCKEISKNENFQNKKLEIGDISLMIENSKNSKTIISIDMPMMQIADYDGFLVIPFQQLTTAEYTIPNIK